MLKVRDEDQMNIDNHPRKEVIEGNILKTCNRMPRHTKPTHKYIQHCEDGTTNWPGWHDGAGVCGHRPIHRHERGDTNLSLSLYPGAGSTSPVPKVAMQYVSKPNTKAKAANVWRTNGRSSSEKITELGLKWFAFLPTYLAGPDVLKIK
jgi:hypothetical protein